MSKLLEFWSLPLDEIYQGIHTRIQGLTTNEATERLKVYGYNVPRSEGRYTSLTLLFNQFKSPILLIFIFSAALSYFLQDPNDSIIILSIVVISGVLGFIQERGATNAVKKLLELVQTKSKVKRDGSLVEISSKDIVPGDIVILGAGDGIPADSLILDSRDLFVNEATLTGESYPVQKSTGALASDTPLRKRSNTVFMGTYVASGTGTTLVINTGARSEVGKLSEHLKQKPLETEFERGVRNFGFFLVEVTLLLVISILVINVYVGHSALNSLLFSLALAIGLTPQLLPAIISVNLAHGAKRMALQKVIVRRLTSIENLGSMNILCSDKTGTLTKGLVELKSALGVDGNINEKVQLYASINAFYETGFINPIDEAIRRQNRFNLSDYHKLDEVPYDFVRKRLSILASNKNKCLIITKGALKNVLEICSDCEISPEKIVDLDTIRTNIQQQFERLSSDGFRILGIAYRDVGSQERISKLDEINMTFLGILVFFDPIKPGILNSISILKQLGVSLKVITGDNSLIATYLAKQLNLNYSQILTGPEISKLTTESLIRVVNDVDLFAEVEPNQKEQIILALKKSGITVGYMGDGVNDASALHAADVGISVDTAIDVLKDAADIVLLEKDMDVLVQAVREGRRTFANTMKYVFMATSANFGNMFSMAGASLFLSFLPLLPKQILLTNLITDLPEMTISTDSVDKELIDTPKHWDIKFIRKFMIVFGILSTVFDYLTFFVLLFILHSTVDAFRTTWFMESVISASFVVLVIRSQNIFFKSRPSKYLLASTAITGIITVIIPFTPFGQFFGLAIVSPPYYLAIGTIVILYIITAEIVKRIFYRWVKF